MLEPFPEYNRIPFSVVPSAVIAPGFRPGTVLRGASTVDWAPVCPISLALSECNEAPYS